jgi:hypothetical protein
MLAAVQWYFRAADLPPAVAPTPGDPNELFASLLADPNPVTALLGPAAVRFGAGASKPGGGGFYVTRQYDHHTQTLAPCDEVASGAFVFRVTKSLVRAPAQALAVRAAPRVLDSRRRAATWDDDDHEEDEPFTDDDDAGVVRVASSSDGEDDGACVCQGRGTGLMVQCDLCDDWFHASCVGLSEASALALRSFLCDSCGDADDDPTRSRRRRRRRRARSQAASGPARPPARRVRVLSPRRADAPHVLDLPTELGLAILAWLPVPDLLAAARACRAWRALVASPSTVRAFVGEAAGPRGHG